MSYGQVPFWQQPLRLSGLAVLVGLCCWASIVLTRGDGRVASIWLSNGLMIGLLLTMPNPGWLPTLAAGFLGNAAANALSSDTPQMAILLALCNSLEIALAAWPLRRRFGRKLDLTTSTGLLSFAAFALLLAPALSGLLAAGLLALPGGDPGQVFAIWFPADVMGILIITPLILALHAQADLQLSRLQWRQAWLPWLLVISSGLLVFSQDRYPLLFLVFPPLLVLTYLQGLVGSMLGVATITVIAVSATINGHGPFMLIDTPSIEIRILTLQVFVLVAAAQGLGTGVLLAQRERLTLALRRSEQNLRTITDSLPALVTYIDHEQRYRFVNAQVGRVFGGDPSSMLGRTMREVRGELVYADIRPHVERALGGETVSFESYGIAMGRPYHYQSNYVPDLAADGSVQGFFAMTFDITERKNAELRQAADEERLRIIADNLPALIAYLDHHGIYRFCNHTHADWFGKPVCDWLGNDYRQVIDEAFADAQSPHLRKALMGLRVDTDLVLQTRGVARNVRASYLPHHAGDGRLLGVYLLMNDITSLKLVQDQLSHLARYDPLTGLANRRELQERIENAIAHSRRHSGSHALMFLDIDHFKAINDTWGHAAGDAVLCEIATRLKACVRQTDTVARLAGDEFVVILERQHNPAESRFIARKMVAAMGKPVVFDGSTITVSLSIGIAFDHCGTLGPEALLSMADKALYGAKAAGRNTFRLIAGDVGSPPKAASAC